MELFNEEDIYDNEISPLVQQIIEVCNKHKIPMIASFTYENCEERGEGRCTTIINNIDNRFDRGFGKALKTIESGGHEVFAVAVTTSKPEQANG